MAFLNLTLLTFLTFFNAGFKVDVLLGLPSKFLMPTIISTLGTTAKDTFEPNSNFL